MPSFNDALPARPRSSRLRQTFFPSPSLAGSNTPRRAVKTAIKKARRAAFEKFLQHRVTKKAKRVVMELLGANKERSFSVMIAASPNCRLTQIPAAETPMPPPIIEENAAQHSGSPSILVTNPTVNGKRTTWMLHQGRTATPPPIERIPVRIAHPIVSQVISPPIRSASTAGPLSVRSNGPVGINEYPGLINPTRIISRKDRRLTAEALNQIDGIKSQTDRRLTVTFRASQAALRPPTLQPIPYRSPMTPEPFERPAAEYVSDHDRRVHQGKVASAFSLDSTVADDEQDRIDNRQAAAAALDGDRPTPIVRIDSVPDFLREYVPESVATQQVDPTPAAHSSRRYTAYVEDDVDTQQVDATSAPGHSSRRYAAYVEEDVDTQQVDATPAAHSSRRYTAYVPESVATQQATSAATPAHSSRRYTAYDPELAARAKGKQAAAVHVQQNIEAAQQASYPAYAVDAFVNEASSAQSSRYSAYQPSDVPRPQPQDAIKMPARRPLPKDASAHLRHKRLTRQIEDCDFDVRSINSSAAGSPYRLSRLSAVPAPLAPSDLATNDRVRTEAEEATDESWVSIKAHERSSATPVYSFAHPRSAPSPPPAVPAAKPAAPITTNPAAQAGRAAMARQAKRQVQVGAEVHCAGCKCHEHSPQQPPPPPPPRRPAPFFGFLTEERKKRMVKAITKEDYRKPWNDHK